MDRREKNILITQFYQKRRTKRGGLKPKLKPPKEQTKVNKLPQNKIEKDLQHKKKVMSI